MKILNHIWFVGVIAATMGVAGSVNAQFKDSEDDGIAASPKVRQMLNERKAGAAAAVSKDAVTAAASAGNRAIENDGIAASPKMRAMMNERRTSTSAPASPGEVASVGYRATGSDGITASPRLRQQLNERRAVITVAPVK